MLACATLTGIALFDCLAANPACLPPAHARHLPILRAIMQQESGGNPYALRDETTKQSLFLANRADAEREARQRHAAGHTLGLGWFQITHQSNWIRHWGSVEAALANAFDPCSNMRAGATHFAVDYAAALARYNSGSFTGAPGYASAVLRRVGQQPVNSAQPAPLTQPLAASVGRGVSGRDFVFNSTR